jgi:alpha-1,2-mannosyltransferase
MSGDKEYYQWLAKKAKQLSANNVKLFSNVNRITLERLILSSKVYLHTMPFEHFGIAVAEVMALGVVPVVHLDLRQGVYGYAYENSEEAVSYVN